MNVMFNIVGYAKQFGRESKRIVIVGSAGSGKTYFANYLTTLILQYGRKSVCICDVKREKKFQQVPILSQAWMKDNTPKKAKIQTIRLNGENYRNWLVAEFAGAVCWIKTECVLYIEEAVEMITKNSVSFPQKHPLCYKCLQQGREFGISVIVATQRPAQLNLTFVDESTDIFIFAMGSRELKDIEDSFRFPKDSLDFKDKPEFGFYHIQKGKDPIFYHPVKPKLKALIEEPKPEPNE